jgi:murein DD-endopeptidase MepM/ murein hydrolase activator NlpD
VTTGQVIGYEGTTGFSTGCHLHFAIHVNGSFENPRFFLP